MPLLGTASLGGVPPNPHITEVEGVSVPPALQRRQHGLRGAPSWR